MFRSYLEPRYGLRRGSSWHLGASGGPTAWRCGRNVGIGVFPLLQRGLGFLQEFLQRLDGIAIDWLERDSGYAELARLSHVLICLEEVADVHGLHSP